MIVCRSLLPLLGPEGSGPFNNPLAAGRTAIPHSPKHFAHGRTCPQGNLSGRVTDRTQRYSLVVELPCPARSRDVPYSKLLIKRPQACQERLPKTFCLNLNARPERILLYRIKFALVRGI